MYFYIINIYFKKECEILNEIFVLNKILIFNKEIFLILNKLKIVK